MFKYHLVDVFTGERLEELYPTTTPSWARRPEPVSGSITVRIRPNPTYRDRGATEGNPSAGLQHRIRPHRHAVVLSWMTPTGTERALAAGVVVSPLKIDERAGTLQIDHKCLWDIMDWRLILQRSVYPFTQGKVEIGPFTWPEIIRRVLQLSVSNYPAFPQHGFSPAEGFELPLDFPEGAVGPHTKTWYGYEFASVASALEDMEEEGQVVVDFVPRWGGGSRLRWRAEVFGDNDRADELMDIGSTVGTTPQARYESTTEDWTELATVTHHTGKGSEVDIQYIRAFDTTPTVMAREKLYSRPENETFAQLTRTAQATYRDAQTIRVQDEVRIGLDPDNPDWLTPNDLVIGGTVQLSVENSLYYGTRTLRRTLVGWQVSGTREITLELQGVVTPSGT